MSFPGEPNQPEITKTTLPLLTTVLAGFAMTIIVQLFIRNDARETWPPHLGLFLGLMFLAVSVPLFMSATIYAIWGQQYTYHHLTQEVREILNIDLDIKDLHKHGRELNAKWHMWHMAAITMFTVGVITFALGTGILLLTFIGIVTATLFFLTIGVAFFCGYLLRRKGKRIDKPIATSP
jgi:hypothetical protein